MIITKITKICRNYNANSKKFCGIPLVRGGNYKKYDGDNFMRTVIWEFQVIKAIECHESKEYQQGWAIAKATTKRHMQIVEGFSIE